MEELLKAAQAVVDKINTASASGVHGTFVAELKELAAKLEEELKKE